MEPFDYRWFSIWIFSINFRGLTTGDFGFADFLYTTIDTDTGENLLINSILKKFSRHRRRPRFATSRYQYNLTREPPAIVIFAALCTWFNQVTWRVWRDQKRFLLFLPGFFYKNFKNWRKCRVFKAHRLTPLTTPLPGHFTVPLMLIMQNTFKVLRKVLCLKRRELSTSKSINRT